MAALGVLAILALRLAVVVAGTSAPATQPAGAARPLAVYVHGRIDAALAQLRDDGDFPAAAGRLRAVFDQVVALAPESDVALFRDADFARRLVEQLSQVPAEDQPGEMLAYLLHNPNLAHTLVFLVKPAEQKPAEVYGTLARLRAHAPGKLEAYASLTAAICLVHQKRPLTRQINENTVQAPDPCDIFDYFVHNEGSMLYGIQRMPAEVLLYVVDTTTPIEQMSWALGRYAGDRSIGDRYFDIKYDTSHLLQHTAKEVTEKGYTLAHILEYGGVCADQAYFTAAVGKAIGVPTAYICAFDADSGHAYVGYLGIEEGKAVWRVDIGRFGGFTYLHGNLLDPQTRQQITDSTLALSAELRGVSEDDRQAAAALTDAAGRLLACAKAAQGFAPPAPAEKVSGILPRPREAKSAAALALLEAGLERCPGYAPGWLTMAQAAAEGQMSPEQKRRWAAVIERFLVSKYPNFAFSLLAPMVRTLAGSAEQNVLWNSLFVMFKDHPDLAAAVRVEQAGMWRGEGKTAQAGQCYEDVFNRFANAGPFVIDALRGAEGLLAGGDKDKVLVLYERVWSQVKPPHRMAPEFMESSVWYRVGKMLIDRLEAAGRRGQAEQVKNKMDNYMTSGGQ
jgi:hypothetical protein